MTLRELVESRTTTPRPWFACTWDPMEVPHIARVEGPHHPNLDIARHLSSSDADLIAAAVNALYALLGVVEAAQAVLYAWDDDAPPDYTGPDALVEGIKALRVALNEVPQ